jgi:hypothetical protein
LSSFLESKSLLTTRVEKIIPHTTLLRGYHISLGEPLNILARFPPILESGRMEV